MLRSYLSGLGFTNGEIDKIINTNPLDHYAEATLQKKIENIYEFLLNNGYSKEDFMRLARRAPQTFSYNVSALEQKINDIISLGYTRLEVISMTKKLSKLFTYSIENMKKKIDDMVSLGYKRQDVIDFGKIVPVIYGFSIENIKERFKYMNGLGFTDKDVIKITKTFPYFYCLSINNIEKRINDLVETYNYSYNDVLKMIRLNANIISGSVTRFDNFLNKIVALGFDKFVVLRMLKIFPQICSLSLENLKSTMAYMTTLGYNQSDVLYVIGCNPKIFSYSISKIKSIFDLLLSFGYSTEEVIKITKELPSIFGFATQNLEDKKAFYDEIGIGDIFLHDPKQIIQSVDLSYARYMFYKSIGIDIDMNNYNLLFLNQKYFEKKYSKTSDDLISEYNYDEHLDKEQSKKRKKELE